MTALRQIALALIARRALQPLWRGLHRLSLGGLGHMNGDPRLNGEVAFLDRLAASWQRRKIDSPVVIDGGAHLGDFSAFVCRRAPSATVYAVEPHPVTAQRLRSRVARDPRVTVLPYALADRDGEAWLYDRVPGGSPHASLYADAFTAIHPAASQESEVRARRLDTLARTAGLRRIHLLKLDLEGGERAALAGAARLLAEGRIEAVLLEFNAHNLLSGLSLLELSRRLEGFDIHRVLPNGLAPLATAKRRYNPREEIYKYANLAALRRADEDG